MALEFGGAAVEMICPGLTLGRSTTFSSNYRLNSTTKKIAYKFIATKTSAITHVNPYITKTGTITGINFKAEIQSDSGDAPSGSVLGAATAEWAGPSASGFLGETALGSNTGSLTIGTSYWLVIYYSSGTAPDASNYIEVPIATGAHYFTVLWQNKTRMYNGSDWTTVATTSVGVYGLKFADSTYGGFPIESKTTAPSGVTAVYGTNRQALKLKFPVATTLYGIGVLSTWTGTPTSLAAAVYEGSTEKASGTVVRADVYQFSGYVMDAARIYFTSPVSVAANTDMYLVLRQPADGGTSGNYFTPSWANSVANYITALAPASWKGCYGTGNDPTALSLHTTAIPLIFPIISDPNTDFSGGGGGIKAPLIGPGQLVRN